MAYFWSESSSLNIANLYLQRCWALRGFDSLLCLVKGIDSKEGRHTVRGNGVDRGPPRERNLAPPVFVLLGY